ncbi:MAG: hypothetical protein ACRELF_29275, partial [Gemmataceae bacterium]
MKTDILDSPNPLTTPEVRPTESTSSSTASRRRLRLALPVSLGVVALLSSLLIAASLRSYAQHGTVSSGTTNPTADEQRWFSLGTVDVDSGITPLYPLQIGRVKSVVAKENVSVKKGAPLLHLDDFMQQQKLREANKA